MIPALINRTNSEEVSVISERLGNSNSDLLHERIWAQQPILPVMKRLMESNIVPQNERELKLTKESVSQMLVC